MALPRFSLPFADVGSGIRISSGAKLYFYETGTSTPKNTFNCPDGTTANSNPVVADSSGLFPDIFVGGTYKAILKDREGTQHWEADPVSAFLTENTSVFTKQFATLADAVASDSLSAGDSLNIAERVDNNGGGAMWDVVLATTVTTNTYNIVASTGTPTVALVLRNNTDDVIDVKEYGALGDGSADDTGAIQSALLTSSNLFFPEGTYKITTALTRTNGVRLVGAGIGRTVLEFQGVNGITIISSNDDYPTYVSDMSFHQTGMGVGTAITLDNSGQISGGVVQNRTSPRLKIENVSVRGTTSVTNAGWFGGLDCQDVMHATLDGFHFEGGYVSTPDDPASSFGIRFYGAGSPVEIIIENSWIFFAIDALRVTDCEGVFVNKCNFVAVKAGIRFDPASVEPQLQVTDCHINAYDVCIVGQEIIDSNIANNLFFARNDAIANVVGLQFSTISFSHIHNNTFVNNSGFTFDGVVIASGGADVVIKDNIFRIATTAIWLQSGSSGVVVGNNTYGTVTSDITDDGTGNIITVKSLAVIGERALQDGLQEKWGSSVVALNGSGDGAISYNSAFSNGFFTAVICNGDIAIEATSQFIVNQGASTTSSLSISVRPNPGAINVRVNWIAKGN